MCVNQLNVASVTVWVFRRQGKRVVTINVIGDLLADALSVALVSLT